MSTILLAKSIQFFLFGACLKVDKRLKFSFILIFQKFHLLFQRKKIAVVTKKTIFLCREVEGDPGDEHAVHLAPQQESHQSFTSISYAVHLTTQQESHHSFTTISYAVLIAFPTQFYKHFLCSFNSISYAVLQAFPMRVYLHFL